MAKRKAQRKSKQSSSPTPEAVEKQSSDAEKVTLGLRADMPSVWFDSVQIARRSDVEVMFMSFYAALPVKKSEQVEVFRGVTTMEHVKKIVDVLARNCDYYPTPGEATEA